MREWLKTRIGKMVLAGTIVAGATLSYLYQKPEVHVVQQGESISSIAKDNLRTPTLADIVIETDRISALNGKGTIEEYPWEEGYSCAGKAKEDPNCIFPGDELDLESQESYALLGLAGIAIATMLRRRGGTPLSRPLPPLASIDELIDEKNNHPYRSVSVEGREEFQRYFTIKAQEWTTGQTLMHGTIARYDNSIAPDDMKKEILEVYSESGTTLSQASIYLSRKYGMNISSSTISKHARKELKVSNRREAQRNHFN